MQVSEKKQDAGTSVFENWLFWCLLERSPASAAGMNNNGVTYFIIVIQ